MDKNNNLKTITNYIAMAFALLMSSFYFVCIQFSVETFLNMAIDPYLGLDWFFAIFLIIIFSPFIFPLYYVARYIEELYVKKNIILRIIFWYILPIMFYILFHMVLKVEKLEINYLIVILFSFIIKQFMEYIFMKFRKTIPGLPEEVTSK